ncbi:hypothetical protein GCM10023264_16950 [Sphingomonas daechungensis]
MLAEVVAAHERNTTAVFESANRGEFTDAVAEGSALLSEPPIVAAALVLNLDPAVAMASIINASGLALDPLRLAFDSVRVAALTRLDIGHVPVAAVATLLLCTVSAIGLEVRKARSASLDALRLAIASALALEVMLLSAAAIGLHLTAAAMVHALHLHLTTATATASLTLSLLATASAAALLLCALASATAMAAAALVRLRCCRRGDRERRDTSYQDEVPHHESPLYPCHNDAFRAPFHLPVDVREGVAEGP